MSDGSRINGGGVTVDELTELSGNYPLLVGNGGSAVAPLSKMSIDSRLHHLTNGTSTCPNDAAGDDDDGFLFDPTVLRNIPWSPESQKKFKGGISAHSPGHDLLLRPLHINDYQKGVLDILAMLTSVGSVSESQFRQQFKMMRSCPRSYYVTVVEDTKEGIVIGCATLQVEYKFIHEAGVRGRIEDVVVSDAYRGRQLGKLLLETLTILGREYVGCYKMSLECKDSLVDFYGQFGYKRDSGNNFLQQRFKV